MKQVTYDFSLNQVIASLVDEYEVEDGFWQLGFRVEHMASQFPKMSDQQEEGTFPGSIQRITGVVLTKVDGWWSNTVHVEKGVITYGPNSNNSGPLPGGESPGENSGQSGEGDPQAG